MIWILICVALLGMVGAGALSYRWRKTQLLQAEEAQRARQQQLLIEEAAARQARQRQLWAEEAAALRSASQAEAEMLRRQAEVDTLALVHRLRLEADREMEATGAELTTRTLEAERRERELEQRHTEIEERAAALQAREQAMRDREQTARSVREQAKQKQGELPRLLEQLAGETREEIRMRLISEWLEEARGQAAERLRRIEAGMNDPQVGRDAQRLMTIAVQRYHGHYLTERLLTNLPIAPGALGRVAGPHEENLRIIEEVSHIKLSPSDSGEAIRLEGQDSFGREIARRAITRFAKTGTKHEADARRICQAIADELDREVVELGRRAFKELEIPRAHPDIVKLVGKLNYRPSYTQNQWKHALEAAFLCGLMASELRLDLRLARRAALLHDIGKALTHEIDGSHAVIGADLARKLGEAEVVANAIGAHHTDEPFNSPYALLVAAADAMSGARPGARRQQDENYVERLEQLRFIASSYPGVDAAYPVQGGREVRIHVQENRVSDARAVEMSSEIARRISDEMTFPGQIKVTVIREVRAVATAN
ncbi:MAG TPA: Rnase Y domain-containing protein [Polyangia bacterium]|nr:Rnase Y domain-containing protein [Polyangia bacterium]